MLCLIHFKQNRTKRNNPIRNGRKRKSTIRLLLILSCRILFISNKSLKECLFLHFPPAQKPLTCDSIPDCIESVQTIFRHCIAFTHTHTHTHTPIHTHFKQGSIYLHLHSLSLSVSLSLSHTHTHTHCFSGSLCQMGAGLCATHSECVSVSVNVNVCVCVCVCE